MFTRIDWGQIIESLDGRIFLRAQPLHRFNVGQARPLPTGRPLCLAFNQHAFTKSQPIDHIRANVRVRYISRVILEMVAQEPVPFGVHFQDASDLTAFDRTQCGRCRRALARVAIMIRIAWWVRSAPVRAASATPMMLRSIAARAERTAAVTGRSTMYQDFVPHKQRVNASARATTDCRTP